MVKITAPDGKKLRDVRTRALYSEIICNDADARFFVVADSDADPIIVEKDGVTLDERVTDLEDAVIELAEVITEV